MFRILIDRSLPAAAHRVLTRRFLRRQANTLTLCVEFRFGVRFATEVEARPPEYKRVLEYLSRYGTR